MHHHWNLLQPDPRAVAAIRRALGCHPLTALLLTNRGVSTPDAARAFLDTSLTGLRPPFAIRGMQRAVRRIAEAAARREKILVFGDYDVDGLTSTAMLTAFLRQIGADVGHYIPHRLKEGYGLQPSQVERVAAPRSVALLVTTDCGSSSHAAVAAARQAGIDVIITDHHRLDASPPAALAVVNPQRPDCEAGFEDLAGAGVVFCLLICLRKHLRDLGFWQNRPEPNLKDYCDLAGLGTLADLVPLRGENRILAATCMAMLRNGPRRPGLQALMRVGGIAAGEVSVEDVMFRLAPRLNAAGRMDHAVDMIELLLTENTAAAAALAQRLDDLNTLRRNTEQTILDEIGATLKQDPSLLQSRALVLAAPGWHEGVLGIVAAKLAERYCRPVALLAVREGVARGSARSIAGFDLYRGLQACADELTRFGGHAMAAGLALPASRLDAFRNKLAGVVTDSTCAADFTPTLTIDAELNLAEIDARLMEAAEALQPFGSSNPAPLFQSRDVRVVSSRIVGGHHRRMRLQGAGGRGHPPLEAIHFNIDPRQRPPEQLQRIAFRLQKNVYNGRHRLQLVIAATG